MSAGINQQVGRFQIAVNYVRHLVGIGQRVAKFTYPTDDLRRLKESPGVLFQLAR